MSRGRWKEDIDALLEGGLEEATYVGLLHMLVPGEAYDTWPSIELLLHLAEHEEMAPILRAEEADERLVEALDKAFTAVAPRLGVRLLGPTWKRADVARRRLDAEERKFLLVAERVEEMDPGDRLRVATAYFRTAPAPIFEEAFEARFAELSKRSKKRIAEGSDLEPLESDPALIEALREMPEGARATLVSSLERLAERDDTEQLMQFGMMSHDDDRVLVAAAIAVWLGRNEFVARMLQRVALGNAIAPYLAVMAGVLSPAVTLNTLGQVLVDAAWENPEEPGSEMTPERAAALVSARCVLPLVGSPLKSMAEGDFPEDIRAISELIDRSWAVWNDVLEGRGEA